MKSYDGGGGGPTLCIIMRGEGCQISIKKHLNREPMTLTAYD